jgi:surface protein
MLHLLIIYIMKLKLHLLLLILLTLVLNSNAQNFITHWNLANLGSGATQIQFNATIAVGGAAYTWQEMPFGPASGSGTFAAGTSLRTITGLPANAVIQLSITPTKLQRFFINNTIDKNRLVDIIQWGSTAWTNMSGAFWGCVNMTNSATDIPNLSGVTNMNHMFFGCSSLNSSPFIAFWNTINVTDMSYMFANASVFNQNISNWNTANVTNMSYMFDDAKAFNRPLDTWNTAKVTDMQYMFRGAIKFNQPIGDWNTANVTNMSYMFNNAYVFNQPIGDWNTANVTDFGLMFYGATAFNQRIGIWNTENATDMSAMFLNATAFNQPIGNWNTAKVLSFFRMFKGASAFNQYLGNWTLKLIDNLEEMFINSGLDCSNYSKTLIGWNNNPLTPNNLTLGALGMEYGTNAEVARTNLTTTKGWTITGDAPSGETCNYNFETRWDLSKSIGSGATQIQFNVSIFNEAVYTWQEISPGNAFGTGTLAYGSNTITGLPANSIIELSISPTNLWRFYIDNGPDKLRLVGIENWGTSYWASMNGAFYGCENMIYSATDYPNFLYVRDMRNMFRSCSLFDGNITTWDTRNITDMSFMFSDASNFNQNIDSWNTSSVTSFSSMFSGATAFNQNLGRWNLNAAVNMKNMLNNSGINCTNYSNTLIGWSNNPTTPNDISLGATGLEYGTYALAARANLNDTKNWTLTGDVASGNFCSDNFVTLWNLANTGSGATQIKFSATANAFTPYTWQEISPVSAKGSGALAYGTSVRTITGLPANAIIQLSIETNPYISLQRFYINSGADRLRLVDVENWGSATWTSMSAAFEGCENLNISATDIPNLSGVEDMSLMFSNCIKLDGPANINYWNTSEVNTMSEMFSNAKSFNQNISGWNTKKVTDMNNMFSNAISFNQDIGNWNIEKVTTMNSMFSDASTFNQNLGSWTLNTNDTIVNMLNNSGLDCSNYSSTLIGWNNNPTTPNYRNLGAVGMEYNASAIADRDNLVNVKSWTITGDTEHNTLNIVVPPYTDEVADLNCNYFTSPLDASKKLINIDPNGNIFDYDNTTVTITNKFVASIPAYITTHTPGTTGYYQTASGTNCFRLGRRMHSVQAPGTYNINDGVKVRVYFNAEDTTYIRTDISPTTPINFYGWLKVVLHNPLLIVNSMNTAAPELPVPSEIVFPIATGIENGSYYAEFLAEKFSTFVYYAATIYPLPVTLSDWTSDCSTNGVNLKWTTESELNNSYFIIESSQDAQNWIEVARINGAGNSSSIKEYSYHHPTSEKTYYRLAQVDFDGNKTYSKIIQSDCFNSLSDIILYPNPNSGTFQIKGIPNKASVTLFNISGQMIWQKSNVQSNERINLDYLPKGIYTISILSNNEMKNKKLIIAK